MCTYKNKTCIIEGPEQVFYIKFGMNWNNDFGD